ncbi:MAG: hypothetical protein AAB263_05025 [Planctomycetota bacterium]
MRNALVPTLLVIASLPLAAADWIRIEPQIGLTKLSGDVTFTDSGVGGTKATMSDLGLGSRETTPGIEIALDPPLLPIGFNFGASRFSTSGSGVLSQNFSFGGTTYTTGTTISSDVTLQDVYGELNFHPPFTRWDLAGISAGLAVHAMQAKMSVAAPSFATQDVDKTAYFPAVTLRAYVSPIDALQIEGAVQYSSLTVGKSKVSYLNAQLQAGYFPIHYLGLFAGYRQVSLDLTVDHSSSNLDASVNLSGPYFGAEARF